MVSVYIGDCVNFEAARPLFFTCGEDSIRSIPHSVADIRNAGVLPKGPNRFEIEGEMRGGREKNIKMLTGHPTPLRRDVASRRRPGRIFNAAPIQ